MKTKNDEENKMNEVKYRATIILVMIFLDILSLNLMTELSHTLRIIGLTINTLAVVVIIYHSGMLITMEKK